ARRRPGPVPGHRRPRKGTRARRVAGPSPRPGWRDRGVLRALLKGRSMTPPDPETRVDQLPDPVAGVLAADLQAAAAGQAPDRAEVLARHPDLADALGEFFGDLDHAERLFAPLRLPEETPSCSRQSPGGELAGKVVGDYELLNEIATGGMGVVFRARQ